MTKPFRNTECFQIMDKYDHRNYQLQTDITCIVLGSKKQPVTYASYMYKPNSQNMNVAKLGGVTVRHILCRPHFLIRYNEQSVLKVLWISSKLQC